MANDGSLSRAFAELAESAIHPSDAEISASVDGLGSAFASAEIRAHLGWCSRCAAVAGEYRAFAAAPQAKPAEDDEEWRRMKTKLPKQPVPIRAQPTAWNWRAAAAGFALCAGLGSAAWLTRTPDVQVVEKERVVEKTVEAPIVAASLVLDLESEGRRLRGGAAASSSLPAKLPKAVTFVLRPSALATPSVTAAVKDATGKAVTETILTFQDGGYPLTLDAALLRTLPVTIELRSDAAVVERFVVR